MKRILEKKVLFYGVIVRTFWMTLVIYLMTFYLFDDIEQNIEITHANHSAT